MEEEIWKDVVGFEGLYQVSNLSRVRSLSKKGLIKKSQIGKDGYKHMSLWNKGKAKRMSVHRIVAIAFIPNPNNNPVVNHLDGNKINNNVNNLEWCTHSENDLHAYRLGLRTVNKTGTGKFGKLNGRSKEVYMLNKDTEEIIKKFDSLSDASYFLTGDRRKNRCISHYFSDNRKSALGYKWRYTDENKS